MQRPFLAFAGFSPICVSLELPHVQPGNSAPGTPDPTSDRPVFPLAGFRADRARAGGPGCASIGRCCIANGTLIGGGALLVINLGGDIEPQCPGVVSVRRQPSL